MAVNHNVHVVLLHNADVGGGVNGLGSAEQNVRQFGTGHGAAPAVGQAAAQSLADQSLRQGAVAHVGHVHSGGDFPVNGPGLDTGLMPQLLGVLGSTLQEALYTEGLAVLQQSHLGDLVGQIIDVLALGLHAPFLGDADQLVRILDLIVAALAGLVQGVHDLAAMVGVGGGATGGEAQIVSAYDAVDVAAADAAGGLGGDAAGAHGADAAAGARFAEAAVGGLVLCALLPGIRADLDAVFQQSGRGSFHLFHRD